MKAQRWATITRSTGTISIYTPTGNHHATRQFRTETQLAAIINRFEIGNTYEN